MSTVAAHSKPEVGTTCASGFRPMRPMKTSSRTRRARSATAIPTKRRRATTGRACASCCSSRAACCAAPIATTPTPGTSRTAPTSRPSRCSAGSAISRPRCAASAAASRSPAASRWCSLPSPGASSRAPRRWACTRRSRRRAFSAIAPTTPSSRSLDLVLLDIKSSDPDTYRRVTGRDLAPTLRFAERLASIGKPVWVRFTLVPGATDDPANVDGHRPLRRADEERRVGRGAAVPSDGRVQVEGDGPRIQARTIRHRRRRELVNRVIGQFRDAGCNAR